MKHVIILVIISLFLSCGQCSTAGEGTSAAALGQKLLVKKTVSAYEFYKMLFEKNRKYFAKERVLKDVKVVDSLGLTGNDRVLSVGPGAEEWHLVAAALYGASVTVVQPDAYQPLTHGLLPTDQRTRLFEKIESAHESAVELLGEDRVNNKIDVQTYRGYVQDVNLPQDNYSHVFLLNVIAVIQGGSEMEFFTAVFDSLKDNAVILISELLEKEEDDFETLNRWGDRLGSYNRKLWMGVA